MNAPFGQGNTPTDDAFDEALRSTLRTHAASVSAPAAFPETTVAAGRRRRRVTATAALSIAVVVAIGIGIPLSFLNTDHRDSIQPITPPTVEAIPTAVPSSTPSTTPVGSASDAFSWTFRGDTAVRQSLETAARQHVSASYPGATISGLWAGTTPSGGWIGYIFRVTVPGHLSRLGVWTARTDGSAGSLVRDDILQPGTIEIDQQLPADPTNMLVVLAPSSTTNLGYTSGGNSVREIPIANGVGFFPLDGKDAPETVDRINFSNDKSLYLGGSYGGPLSAGGFVVLSGPPSGSRELVVNGLFQAWLAGDRNAASTYGTATAVAQLFAIPPDSSFVGGACVGGGIPAPCQFQIPDGSSLSRSSSVLTFTIDAGTSTAYRVSNVKLTG